jgi:glycosidase
MTGAFDAGSKHRQKMSMRFLSAGTVAIALAGLTGCSDARLEDRPDPNAKPAKACVPAGTTCPVVFRYPIGNGASSVELRGDFAPGAWMKGVPMQIEGTRFRAEIPATDGAAIQYKFFVNGKDWVTDPFNPNKAADGTGGENSVLSASCDFDYCPVEPSKPVAGSFDWRSAVMYFVFVDRFYDGDKSNNAPVNGVENQANYQGGDWAGVIKKIDDGYFESLGVNALWLTVPADNPSVSGIGHDGHQYSAYHGYWASDLEKPEEHFGSMETLKKLIDRAHARGIKVLFDYAMNHVHDSSPLFKQHPEWFWPLNYDNKTCVCGNGCDWNDSYQQKRCWFTPYLPDWNFTNAAARKYSVDNAIKWVVDTGADGFRLDAVKHIELAWLTDLRARVKKDIEPKSGEHFYMVGETFESANRDILKYYVGDDRLDGQFDFPLRAVLVEKILRRTGTMHDLDSFLSTNDHYYGGIMSTFIGNHDILRTIHVAQDQPWDAWAAGDPWGAPPSLPVNAAPFERVGVAFAFLFTTKGIPLVYYGDEIGLPGAGDPDNRRFMKWPELGDKLSEHQLALQTLIKKLGAIRRDHPALWRGNRTKLSVTDDTYSYAMSDGQEIVYVALNRGDTTGAVGGMPVKGRDLVTGATLAGPQINLPPRSARIVIAEK